MQILKRVLTLSLIFVVVIALSGCQISRPIFNENEDENTYYIITVTASGSGTVAGEGTYVAGSLVTVTATPNQGYVFGTWRKDGNIVSIDATYTFTVFGNVELVANFEEEPDEYIVGV